MSSLPHITILMGTRNGAAFLRQQLASLAAQDHPRWSLWISDDGSTDATGDVIRTFADTCPNPVLMLAGPEQGLAANYLHLLCHPDLPGGPVAFADQDDLWLPTHLTRGLTALCHDGPTAGQAYVPHRLLQRGGEPPHPMPWRVPRPPTFRNALVECLLAGSGLMLDAAAVATARAIGPVEVPFWDWWLYMILTGTGAQIHHDHTPGVIYRAHDTNALGPRHGMRAKLWRIKQLGNGTYRRWTDANLAALEPYMDRLTPEARAVLHTVLPLPPKHRLRHLSRDRHWPQDRLALWLAA
ncbi:glycosyltransferase [Marivita sp. S6314]|uniref:glycosyltransferase n=1 Tax=Marivita sp. S6314 TaxID=2926406 RepID=UPI001FF10621|nr:glycosyltransferase [Marivita sp. S6314]MCK0151967.1 glycosyltransferase [Marivita sp. S6314]